MPETTIHLNGKKPYEFDVQANQLSDILCRGAVVSSVQSTNNTLTRNSTLRDTGDYDVPHPHPYTHHYMTTSAAATPQAMSMVGSRPGSASGSGSSPGVSAGSESIPGNNHQQLDPLFAQCISYFFTFHPLWYFVFAIPDRQIRAKCRVYFICKRHIFFSCIFAAVIVICSVYMAFDFFLVSFVFERHTSCFRSSLIAIFVIIFANQCYSLC